MVNSNKKHTGGELDSAVKTARIRARFDAIAQAHGLIPSDTIDDVSGQVQQKVDITIGDGGTIITEEESTSQIMEEELPPPSSSINSNNVSIPVLVNRNNLQIQRSVISIYDADGILTRYHYVGKSKNTDNFYTNKRFLKLEVLDVGGDDTEKGRIDVWNGVISPVENIRFGLGKETGGYSEKIVLAPKEGKVIDTTHNHKVVTIGKIELKY